MASGKALFLRNLPTDLVREAKAAAARRGKTLTAIVAEALSRSLEIADNGPDVDHDLERDMAWYRVHRAKLLQRYSGEYLAIIDAAMVDHGPDFGELAERVFARFGSRSVYMPRVQAAEPVARIRSPRRVRP